MCNFVINTVSAGGLELLHAKVSGTLLLTLTFTPAWVSNHIHFKVWDEIIYLFPNFNGAIVEVWEWISNFIAQFTGHIVIYPCWN